MIAQGKSEEEMEKRLGAALLAGDTVIALDNCEAPLGGDLLCQALTQSALKIRVLGHSRNVEVPSNAVLFATGNNLVLAGDFTRRALLCALDPQCERPELREFASDPLRQARDRRSTYLAAALTVLRAYRVAGAPSQTAPLGSFAEWSRWVRDALVWLGREDPCATMTRTRATDPKLGALAGVLEQWDAVIGDSRVPLKVVIERAVDREDRSQPSSPFLFADFRDALLAVAGDAGAINSRRLGKWLLANQGRVIGGRRMVQDGGRAGVAYWCLQNVGDAG